MDNVYDLLVTNGHCVVPGGIVAGDIGIRHGKIAAIGVLSGAAAKETFNAAGLHVLPGVIDSQVHFREPGLEHKENLETGTRSAVLGGVTTIFEMPNTHPQTLTVEDFSEKLHRAQGRAWCDHAFFIGAAAENVEHLDQLERLPGCSGVKVFMGSSTGGLLVETDEVLRSVLQKGFRRVAVHCEDEPRLRERKPIAEEAGRPHAHPEWRDAQTALRATQRLVALAEEVHRQVHVLHVTTAEEMAFLAEHKEWATVEVTPQHLTLTAPDCYDRLGTLAQMNPPIRDKHHQDALWQAVTNGIVDVIGSDHAPHTRSEKEKPYPQSPAGMPGVQTLLPLMLNHVNAGRLSLLRLMDLVCAGPARIYNIQGKGRLVVGYDGDLTLVDLKAQQTITHGMMASRCGWTPFNDMTVTGFPVATVIRGHLVMQDNEVLGEPAGQPVRFGETGQMAKKPMGLKGSAWSPSSIDPIGL